MREKDYILATNLTKARIARQILADIHISDDDAEREPAMEMQRTLYRWIAKWERNV